MGPSSHENKLTTLPEKYTGTTGRGSSSLTPPAEITTANSLNEILVFARKCNASDVHLSAGRPIIFRQFSQLKNMSTEPLSADQIHALMTKDLPANIMATFEGCGDAEYVHTVMGYGRFRMSLMKQRNGFDLTARLIPLDIPSLENIGMPPACAGLTKWAQGLVLLAGPAGSGKTTTLAALIELINQNRHDHIITIEEPVEIVYEPKQCQVTQREINIHTLSRNNALRAALREDPDILVVSELRDLSTIQLSISAAETGHLVFGTMNTLSATQTISKLIDSFPLEEQGIIRNMISESLRGVICQQLIPKKDGTGMVAAFEVLLVTQPVANLIREGKIIQINSVMTMGKAAGMLMMDNSLAALASSGAISSKDACERATNPASMLEMING